MPNGRLPTAIGAPVTWPEERSMRVTVASALLVTHSLPPATARSWGDRPTGIFVTRRPTTRATARSLDSATHTAPRATTGLSGWRPTASGSPCCLPVSASKRCSVPALALATSTRPPENVMPSGPRSVASVEGCAGLAEAGLGVRVGVAVAAAFSPATNAATASISAADSESLKAGIVPLPFSTVVLTTAALGLRLSRFGPTLPFVPAAASVWQPPQLEVKTFLPSGAAPPPPPPAAAAGLTAFAPINVGPTSSASTVKAAASQVTGARMRSTLRSTSGGGEPVLGDEPQPAGQPGRDQEREQQAAGQRQRDRWEPAAAHDHDLGRERAVEQAAEQRVREHPRRRGLEGELVEAVVRDRKAEQERQPAGDAVRAADPLRRVAERELPVHPRRRQHLRDRQQRRGAGQPHFHRDGVAEAERDREVAGRVVEVTVDPQRDRHERPDGRHPQQPRPGFVGARCGGAFQGAKPLGACARSQASAPDGDHFQIRGRDRDRVP